MGAVAPKPTLSTHPYSKLLGFLAFSHDSSFSTLSEQSLTNWQMVDRGISPWFYLREARIARNHV